MMGKKVNKHSLKSIRHVVNTKADLIQTLLKISFNSIIKTSLKQGNNDFSILRNETRANSHKLLKHISDSFEVNQHVYHMDEAICVYIFITHQKRDDKASKIIQI